MSSQAKARIAWVILIYNVAVVIWGVFLRASKSGDGCGRYWLTCHGEVIPSAPELKTIIEYSHRLMSGLDFFLVLGLALLVLIGYKESRQLRLFAILSFVFIVTEALIGAGLVLTGNVAETQSAARPAWAVGHLINTFLLLGSLTITARMLSTGRELRLGADKALLLISGAGTAAILFVGITGAIAALSNTLFPSNSLAEAFLKDFDPGSNLLLRLRILHPLGSVVSGVLLIFAATWIRRRLAGSTPVVKLTGALSTLVVTQLILGALTLLTGAPIIMQLLHLLVADFVWIVWILIVAEAFSQTEVPES